MQTIKCHCGFEILLLENAVKTSIAIEEHLKTHRKETSLSQIDDYRKDLIMQSFNAAIAATPEPTPKSIEGVLVWDWGDEGYILKQGAEGNLADDVTVNSFLKEFDGQKIKIVVDKADEDKK